MRLLNPTKRSPIGLDLGSEHVKAVQLVRQGRRWLIAAATCFHRLTDRPAGQNEPAPAAEPADDPTAPAVGPDLARIGAVLDRQGFAGRRLAVLLPADRVKTSPLELPPAGASVPMEQVAQMEFARIHQLPPGSFEMAWWPVQAPTRGRAISHVMAVGCRHEDAWPLLHGFQAQRMTVQAMVPHVHVLAEIFRRVDPDRTGVAVMLDLGWSAARLVVLYQGVVVYERPIPELGVQVIHRNLARHLDMDTQCLEQWLGQQEPDQPDEGQWSQPLVRTCMLHYLNQLQGELKMALSYAAHRYPDSPTGRLWLVGGGAAITPIGRHLAQAVDIETQVARPDRMLEAAPAAKALAGSPQLTVAAALALMEAQR